MVLTSTKKKRSTKTDTVGVFLRLRPLRTRDDEATLEKLSDQQVKTRLPDETYSQIYSFTHVFDENAPQSSVFEKVARPIVEEFITRAKDGLLFTYGVTGAGKTYTMEGLEKDPGLIYRTIDFLFKSIGTQQTPKKLIANDGSNFYYVQEGVNSIYPNLGPTESAPAYSYVAKLKNHFEKKESGFVNIDPNTYYCLFISLIELYNRQVHDLLDDPNNSDKTKKKLEIRTDKRGHSYVAYATQIEVKSAEEAVEVYTRGIKRRKTGSTSLNKDSSRGHCVLNLTLVQVHKSYDGNFNEDTLLTSQLCLVDLAGSERTKKSQVEGKQLDEACNINKSLTALRICIRALRDGEKNFIQYRDYTLTRLFKSYFEGHGSVRMVLCVKPTKENYTENNDAMELGVLTQEVAIDYASPPKMLKRSKSIRNNAYQGATMYGSFEKKLKSFPECDNFVDFSTKWRDYLETKRSNCRKNDENLIVTKNLFREILEAKYNETEQLREKYETLAKAIRTRELEIEQVAFAKNEEIKNLKRLVDDSTKLQNQDLKLKYDELQSKYKQLKRLTLNLHENQESKDKHDEKLLKELATLLKNGTNRNDTVTQMLKKIDNQVIPSAPELHHEPLHSSSPIGFSTSETPTTTTTNSSEAMDFHHRNHQQQHHHLIHNQQHDQATRSSTKELLVSPTNGGVPVVNPRHNRSLSCSSMQWIHHKPQGTIDTGTVMKPKFKNGRSVKNLRSSDILKKNAGGYSVIHQDANENGEVETSIYKGPIISTHCGGAQVILNDIETMRQLSPERKRAASDAHYTH